MKEDQRSRSHAAETAVKAARALRRGQERPKEAAEVSAPFEASVGACRRRLASTPGKEGLGSSGEMDAWGAVNVVVMPI